MKRSEVALPCLDDGDDNWCSDDQNDKILSGRLSPFTIWQYVSSSNVSDKTIALGTIIASFVVIVNVFHQQIFTSKTLIALIKCSSSQGGRSWQPFTDRQKTECFRRTSVCKFWRQKMAYLLILRLLLSFTKAWLLSLKSLWMYGAFHWKLSECVLKSTKIATNRNKIAPVGDPSFR